MASDKDKSCATKSGHGEEKKDYYKTLGVERSATASQIKAAYRKMAMANHPDKNPGDERAAERFKEVSIAYAVLSDPNKRRQYDVSGSLGAGDSLLNFEGVDPSDMGGASRMFAALFTKIGVPIPTTVTPTVLEEARRLCSNQNNNALYSQNQPKSSTPDITELTCGVKLTASVSNQQCKFYRFHVTEEMTKSGFLLSVRSPKKSRFKLILFDREGSVRKMEDSQLQRRSATTVTDMFFNFPFDRASLSPPEDWFVQAHREKTDAVPSPFRWLDGLEPCSDIRFSPGESHLVAVYGDNWLNTVKYNLTLLPLKTGDESIGLILSSEHMLLTKKKEMEKFQEEFMAKKQLFENAVERLNKESAEIVTLLNERDKGYDDLIECAETKCRPTETAVAPAAGINNPSPKGLWTYMFGNKK